MGSAASAPSTGDAPSAGSVAATPHAQCPQFGDGRSGSTSQGAPHAASANPTSSALSNERRRALAGAALGEMEVEVSRLTALVEERQRQIWERAQTLSHLRREERARAGTPGSKTPQALHRSRSLVATAKAAAALLWMQEQLIECRRAKAVLVERLESAWMLVGREHISAHLLDVLERRIANVDAVAMQNLIDVEESWLLSKAPPPTRTGGGWHRGGKRLAQEAEWYHNLEVRLLSMDMHHTGPTLPPPSAHGLRYDERDRRSPARVSATALWPDAASARPSWTPPG